MAPDKNTEEIGYAENSFHEKRDARLSDSALAGTESAVRFAQIITRAARFCSENRVANPKTFFYTFIGFEWELDGPIEQLFLYIHDFKRRNYSIRESEKILARINKIRIFI